MSLRPSLDAASERIALRHVTALDPALQPADALRRGAMGEALRHDIALRLLLQRVVADRLGGAQAGLDIAGLQQILVIGRPDAGEAIRLQLHLDLQLVGLGPAGAVLL